MWGQCRGTGPVRLKTRGTDLDHKDRGQCLAAQNGAMGGQEAPPPTQASPGLPGAMSGPTLPQLGRCTLSSHEQRPTVPSGGPEALVR